VQFLFVTQYGGDRWIIDRHGVLLALCSWIWPDPAGP